LGKIGALLVFRLETKGFPCSNKGMTGIWRSSKQDFKAAGVTAGKVPLIFPEKSFGRVRVQLPLSEE